MALEEHVITNAAGWYFADIGGPQPWGLSGPQFLWLYAIALVGAGLLTYVARKRVVAVRDEGPIPEIRDVFEAAYLSGGPARVAQVALARLALSDLIRASRTHRLQATGATTLSGIEATVHRTVREGTDVTFREVVAALQDDADVAGIRSRLEQQGLITTPTQITAVRSACWPLLLVGAVGVVRAVHGTQLHRPVQGLVALLIVTVALIVAAVAEPPMRTKRGEDAVRQLRTHDEWSVGMEQELLTRTGQQHDLAVAVAVGVALAGATAFPETDLRNALFGGGASSGGWGWGGDGGGGGGGGCGGGGCGGGCGG